MIKPYYETPNGKLYHGDCLKIMPELELADLVVADSPYNINKAEWDRIPNYLEWCGKWLLECQRVLKDNSSFYFFHNHIPTIARLMIWIEENTHFIFKQFITWNKYFQGSKDEGFCKHRLSNNESRKFYGAFTEYCLFYTFQDDLVLLDQRDYLCREWKKSGLTIVQIKKMFGFTGNQPYNWFAPNNSGNGTWQLPTKKHYKKLQTTGFFQRPYEDLRYEYEDLRYTFNNQKVMAVNFNSQNWNNNVWNYEIAEKVDHATPKPVDLISNIILHSSNEGDIVLDPFAGSGTTAIACERLNRRWIGIEIEEKYCEIAKQRITREIQQTKLW